MAPGSGAAWTRVSQGLPRSYGATLIAFDPLLENRLFAWIQQAGFDATVGELVRSTDGGTTWKRLSNGPQQGQRIQSLAVDPRQPRTLYASTDRAVYKSVDGGSTWKPTALSSVGFVYALKMHPGLGDVYAGTDRGLFRSHDGGEGGASQVAVNPLDGATVYLVLPDGTIRRTRDSGQTWETTGHLPTPPVQCSNASLVIDSRTPTTLYTGGPGVGLAKSTDGGDTWTLLSDALRVRDPGDMVLSPFTSGLLYVGVMFDDVYEIQNGSGTAEPLGTSPSGEFYTAIAVDPTDPCRIYAGTAGNGLLAFTKSGAAGCK